MDGPLSFSFLVDEPHRTVRVASLRLAAATRVALLQTGIETLGDLDGLSGYDLARIPRVTPQGALAVVRAVRWRCIRQLPSWVLIRSTMSSRLPPPLNQVRRMAGPFGALPTLADVVATGPQALSRVSRMPPCDVDGLFDLIARIAQLDPDALLRISSHHNPYQLPAIHPLVTIAFAQATCLDEQWAALTVGPSVRDAAIVLSRWAFGSADRPTFAVLGQRFGLTGERIRQIVEERGRQVLASGLILPPEIVPPLNDAVDDTHAYA